MSGWVLATRAADDLEALASALAAQGVRVVGLPVLSEEPVDAPAAELDAAARDAALVAFTSRRAPAALRAAAGGDSWARLLRLPAAAVGETTADAAGREGFRVSLVGLAGGASLAGLIADALRPGDRVLHPCGRERREELGRELAARGVRVIPLVVYAMAAAAPESLPPLPEGRPVAVYLTSPRAAQAYLRAAGGRYRGVPHVALGAATAAAAAAAGVAARVPALTNTESVVEELCRICC